MNNYASSTHRVTLREVKGRLAARPMPLNRDGGYAFGTPQPDGSIKLSRKARRHMETLCVLAKCENITPKAAEYVADRQRTISRALAYYMARCNERAAHELAAREILTTRFADQPAKPDTQGPHIHKQHADIMPSTYALTAEQRKAARAHARAKIKNSEKF